eukprot:5118904-Ditylum_brightwellii.AAC.1
MSKGLRHVQIHENAVREANQNNCVVIYHVAGKLNFADIVTKEDTVCAHFLSLRNSLMSLPSGLHLPFQPVPSQCKSATIHLLPSDFLATTLAHNSFALLLPLGLRVCGAHQVMSSLTAH